MNPIALLVDDGCPLIHVYRYHRADTEYRTADGRELLETIPNRFLGDFCGVCERWAMAGKFSIVPAPAWRGDVVGGIKGFPPEETRAWLETAVRRLGPRFDFTPEMLTHSHAVDLETGGLLPGNEHTWSQKQTRATLTPYLTRSLELLKAAGVDANGFTSPWSFGIQVEEEYVAAIAEAQRAVYGRADTWYFLHTYDRIAAIRPWVARRDPRGRVVSIPTTVPDIWWETIDDPEADPEGIAGRAAAQAVAVAEAGGIPTVLTHWQSLFSNGLETGLRALDLFAGKIAAHGGFTWVRCSELAAGTPEEATRPAL